MNMVEYDEVNEVYFVDYDKFDETEEVNHHLFAR